MLKLGEKILLAVLQLKHSGVNEDTCAKSIQANGVFFSGSDGKWSVMCPNLSCFSQWMQQAHSFWMPCRLRVVLSVCLIHEAFRRRLSGKALVWRASHAWSALKPGELSHFRCSKPVMGGGGVHPEQPGEVFLRPQLLPLQGEYLISKPNRSNAAVGRSCIFSLAYSSCWNSRTNDLIMFSPCFFPPPSYQGTIKQRESAILPG